MRGFLWYRRWQCRRNGHKWDETLKSNQAYNRCLRCGLYDWYAKWDANYFSSPSSEV